MSPFQHILNKIANNLMQQSDLIWGPCYGISPVDYNLMQPNQRHEIIETLINRHVQTLEHEMLLTNDFILEKSSGYNIVLSILTLSTPNYNFAQILAQVEKKSLVFLFKSKKRYRPSTVYMANLMLVCQILNYQNFYRELREEFLDAFGLS